MEFPFDNWLTWERCETDTSVGGVLVGVTTAAPPLSLDLGPKFLDLGPITLLLIMGCTFSSEGTTLVLLIHFYEDMPWKTERGVILHLRTIRQRNHTTDPTGLPGMAPTFSTASTSSMPESSAFQIPPTTYKVVLLQHKTSFE